MKNEQYDSNFLNTMDRIHASAQNRPRLSDGSEILTINNPELAAQKLDSAIRYIHRVEATTPLYLMQMDAVLPDQPDWFHTFFHEDWEPEEITHAVRALTLVNALGLEPYEVQEFVVENKFKIIGEVNKVNRWLAQTSIASMLGIALPNEDATFRGYKLFERRAEEIGEEGIKQLIKPIPPHESSHKGSDIVMFKESYSRLDRLQKAVVRRVITTSKPVGVDSDPEHERQLGAAVIDFTAGQQSEVETMAEAVQLNVSKLVFGDQRKHLGMKPFLLKSLQNAMEMAQAA